MNCICQNAPQRPGVTEVLDSLQQHTVCTDTACYEGEEAAFGVTAGQSAAPSNQNMFFLFMTCAPPPSPKPPAAATYARAVPLRALHRGRGRVRARETHATRRSRGRRGPSIPAPTRLPPRRPAPSLRFMMFVAMMLRMQRPSPQLTSKAGSSSSHANQPPPGPPPPPPAPEVD